MNIQFVSILSLLMILLLNACSTFSISGSTGWEATPEVGFVNVPGGYQAVAVDDVQAEVGVGSPIPVQVIVSGNLPDSCAQIEFMRQKQEGSHFSIALSTIPSAAEGCVQDTLPFRILIPLNIVNLPAGSYTVDVNGSSASFEVATGNTTSSLPSAASEITRDDIKVPGVNVEVGVGSPIPVHAIVGLEHMNTCAQVGEMRLHRDSNIFYIQLIADIAKHQDCQQDPPSGSIPFRMEVPLNMVNLPDGSYQVIVNGTTTTFDWPAQSANSAP
jgi:hypothetical protein